MAGPITILCSNLKGNLGDFAILEAIGRYFEKNFPGSEVRYFYHANKHLDNKRYPGFLRELSVKMTDMGPAPFYPRPKWYRIISKLPGTARLSQLIHNALIKQVADMLETDLDFVNALSESRFVVFAGGSQWGKANLNLNMFAQLACACRHNDRVLAFPFGISRGAFECNGPEVLGEMLSQLTPPVAVRDVISHRLLQSVGVDSAHVSDCVFTTADLFESLRAQAKAQTRKVYVSLTGSGQTTASSIVDLFARLRLVGYEPILFSSCESEDRPQIDEVLALEEVIFNAPSSWKESVHLFAEAAFIITNRLHCMIFSALAGAAVVPITNRQKAEAYAEDVNLDFAPREISEITEQSIRDFESDFETVRAKQIAYLKKSAATTEVAINKICGL